MHKLASLTKHCYGNVRGELVFNVMATSWFCEKFG